MAPVAVAAISAAVLKGLGKLFGKKSQDKKAKEQKRADVSKLNTLQKQREDARRARVRLGASYLNGVPATTAGGGVRTNVGLDPKIQADLEKERTYDFDSTIPDPGVGGTSGLLSGLFGELGDTTIGAFGVPTSKSKPSPSPSSGSVPPGAPSSPLIPLEGITRTPWVPYGEAGTGDQPGLADNNAGLTIEDLMELMKIRPGGQPKNYEPDPESGGF